MLNIQNIKFDLNTRTNNHKISKKSNYPSTNNAIYFGNKSNNKILSYLSNTIIKIGDKLKEFQKTRAQNSIDTIIAKSKRAHITKIEKETGYKYTGLASFD